MKVIIIDIFGEYGHFRKYWTTTSPLTYNFIPPTSVYGIISAIMGIDKSRYLELINYRTLKIAQRIINPITKVRIPINLVDTKDNIRVRSIDEWRIRSRTQIRFEFLRNPHFRLYLLFNDSELGKQLEIFLKNEQNFYTISLGLGFLLANVKYIGSFNFLTCRSNEYVFVHSIIPVDKIKEICFEENKNYVKDRVVVDMTVERKVNMYKDIVAEINANTIKCITDEYVTIENSNENIVFI